MVPESERGVRRRRHEEISLLRMELDRVHLLLVRTEFARAVGLADVVEENAAVVAAAGEHVVVEGMPRNVLEVTSPRRSDFDDVALLFVGNERLHVERVGVPLNVPHAHALVVAARRNEAFPERRPAQTVAFLRMTLEDPVGSTDGVSGNRGVFANVKQEHVAHHRLCRQQHRVLRHAARSITHGLSRKALVDLAVVVDTHNLRNLASHPRVSGIGCP